MISFIGVFIGSILFAIIFKKPLRRYPWIFYVIAAALSSILLFSFWISFPRTFQMIVLYPLQRCYIAFSLFTIVMFLGVFKDESRIKAYFLPIRAELSILACIFTVPHIIRNIVTFLPKLFTDAFGISIPIYLSVVLALILTVLLVLLGITSFKTIKEKMHTATWKKIQRLAYVFFIIIFLHLGLMLIPSAMRGGVDALQNLIIYGVIFVLYVVLRIRRALLDRSARQNSCADKDTDAARTKQEA